jgi:glycosyltransferase involved in cell wall biosynthesis
LRRLKPQLILAYWLYPEGYAAVTAGRKLGIPVVVGARGSDLKLEDPLTRPMALRALRDSNGVIVVSEDMRRRALAFGAPPGNVHTVLNGVDRSIFHLQSRQAARAVLGIDAATRLVSFVGWLSRTKGLAELADAITELKRRGGNIQLVCIGEGPLAEELRLRSQPGGDLHNGVIMAGPLMGQAIARWLAASDLLCLPSHAEGLPNVVLEALACGRPVVASDVGGIPEIIRPDCGLLVPARDTARLAEAIHQALAAEWDENVIAGRWSRTWQDSAHETYRICQWAAGRANGPA